MLLIEEKDCQELERIKNVLVLGHDEYNKKGDGKLINDVFESAVRRLETVINNCFINIGEET